MENIAIIGTPGAGKTIFLSVLAMRYREARPGKPQLEYLNLETQKHVSKTWDTLQGQDWPASTPPGMFPKLQWTLIGTDGYKYPIQARDPAGQDIMALYELPPEQQTEHQKELKRTILEANTVLFLVNLREIINAVTQKQIDDIEVPIKLAIQDVLQRNDTSVALVLTQHDSYADYLVSQDAAFRDPARAIQKYLPQIGGQLLRNPNRIKAFYVAAVAETVSVIDDRGKASRRPKRNFVSQGMNEVVEWVHWAMAYARRGKEIAASEAQANAVLAKLNGEIDASNLCLVGGYAVGIILAVCAFASSSGYSWMWSIAALGAIAFTTWLLKEFHRTIIAQTSNLDSFRRTTNKSYRTRKYTVGRLVEAYYGCPAQGGVIDWQEMDAIRRKRRRDFWMTMVTAFCIALPTAGLVAWCVYATSPPPRITKLEPTEFGLWQYQDGGAKAGEMYFSNQLSIQLTNVTVHLHAKDGEKKFTLDRVEPYQVSPNQQMGIPYAEFMTMTTEAYRNSYPDAQRDQQVVTATVTDALGSFGAIMVLTWLIYVFVRLIQFVSNSGRASA